MADGRSFIKGLRYNLGAASALACATLTDCEGSAPLLFIVPAGVEDSGRYLQTSDSSAPVWLWCPTAEAIAPLPRVAGRPRAAGFLTRAEAAAAGS